jgi:hypothetical protein
MLWIALLIVYFVVLVIFHKRFAAVDRWMVRIGIVPNNRWITFVMMGVGVGVAIVPGGSAWGWLWAAFLCLVLWWDRTPQREPQPTPKTQTKAPELTVNLEWPHGKGFTQCSHEYNDNHNSLDFFNPAKYSQPRPEDYEQYAVYLRERARLIAEGHTGKSFRYDESQSGAHEKIRVTRGFFTIEHRCALVECAFPPV